VPRFSILVPVFNAAPYIADTLDSVRKQGHPSVEVIVTDGASTDGTVEIVRAFEGLDITLISEPDRGQLDALQKAARLATGDVLYWLNADDVLLPGSLAKVDATFAADPDLDLVFSDDFAFDEAKRILVNGSLIRGLNFKDHALFYRQMYSECVFWRRGATKFLPDSDYDLRICTDYAFFLNMRPGLKSRWVEKRLGAFRMLPGQASDRFRDRHLAEFARIRNRAYADAGWSPGSVRLRRLLHAPSFLLRQRLRPALHAAARAARRRIDGNARREAMTKAFFDDWLHSREMPGDDLVRLLYR